MTERHRERPEAVMPAASPGPGSAPAPAPAALRDHAGRALPSGAKRPTIASEALFAGATEVHIEHRGALYRLKQTALGKLILTK